MRITSDWRRKRIASGLAMLLALPLSEAAAQQQPVFQGQEPQSTATVQDQANNADGAAGKADPNASETDKKESEGSSVAPSSDSAQKADSPSVPPSSEPQQNTPTVPVGTAASPYEKPVGTAVARPAGAAIAPAKQRRSRSFKIRIAVVVGIVAAVGTVVALSVASPSKPN